MLAHRSRFRYFSGKASAAGRVVEAVLKDLQGRGRILFQLLSEVVKPGAGFLLRTRL
jgi:hypothetical protein